MKINRTTALRIKPKEPEIKFAPVAAYFRTSPGKVRKWIREGAITLVRTPAGHVKIIVKNILN